ncbi:hypothetical protein EYZ11_011407 [Aspergillus tanneri]|uniref:Carotenoid oxygenase n=1 Tax=Aspergillus tanneri TaxID=1220188 RepID=A0A4S3J2V7_9EURO|nr:hypothetical protein EYZ11_011407 [Aspergillus tanneri]
MAQIESCKAPFNDWPNDAGFEASVEHREPVELTVTGSIPSYLAGTLYRIGPGTYKVEGSAYQLSHWFDGFSYLHRFQLVAQPTGKCKVLYNSRGQVDALIEEARKSGTLKGLTFGQKRDPCESIFRKVKVFFRPAFNQKNSELVNAGVTIYANAPGVPRHLKQSRSSSPFSSLTSLTDANILKHIDPETLQPLGVTRQDSLHPDLKGPLSCAHAEFDAASGDMYNYNLDLGRYATYRIFRTCAATGATKIIATIRGPDVKPAYLHSFFLSEDYVILCIWPAIIRMNGIQILWKRNLADAIQFNPSLQARWYVVDRKQGRGVVAMYLSPAFFSFHTINAWQKDNGDGTIDVMCDIIQYPTDEMIQRGYYDTMVSTGSEVTKYYGSEASRPSLVRYRLPGVPKKGHREAPANGTDFPEAETLLRIDDNCVGDLPTINPKFNTKKTRYVYNLVNQGKVLFLAKICS